jgi:hypothetical protein
VETHPLEYPYLGPKVATPCVTHILSLPDQMSLAVLKYTPTAPDSRTLGSLVGMIGWFFVSSSSVKEESITQNK